MTFTSGGSTFYLVERESVRHDLVLVAVVDDRLSEVDSREVLSEFCLSF